ncbi:MAG: DUF1838 domain-containing protein [Alphaproteobacteria bacterium]|nr:DUF1838 domain-containing protein [Alphaproteobacteria bacterium]
MDKVRLTRRDAVVSAGALAFGTGGHAAAAGHKMLPDSIEDWSLEDRVYALAKQQGRVDDGKAIWRTRGVIYGFKAPESPIPLVRFKGCEQQWVKKVSDAEFVKYNSLLTYYSDFETDEIIDGFVNPMTGEDVTFKPNWSRVPEGQSISVRGATLNIVDKAFPDFYSNSSIHDVEMNLIGDTVAFHAKMRWPEPLVRNPYNQDNTFFANISDLQDPEQSWIPAHGAGQILMPSMASIGMKDPDVGQVIWHVEFYKVKSWDDLPEDYLTKALAEHGEDFDVNPVNDTVPSKLAQNLARLGYVKE